MSVFSKIRILKNLIVLSIILLSCDDSKKNRNSDDNSNTDSLVVDNNATQNMILDIQKRVAEINVETVPYIFNNAKVAKMEQRLQMVQGNKRLNLLFSYGLELLNAGKTEKSIDIFNELLQAVETQNVQSKNELVYYLKKQLSIAYMRKAEQDN